MSRPPDLMHLYRDYRHHVMPDRNSVACWVNEDDFPSIPTLPIQTDAELMNAELVFTIDIIVDL